VIFFCVIPGYPNLPLRNIFLAFFSIVVIPCFFPHILAPYGNILARSNHFAVLPYGIFLYIGL
jgi:hypothetical protein